MGYRMEYAFIIWMEGSDRRKSGDWANFLHALWKIWQSVYGGGEWLVITRPYQRYVLLLTLFKQTHLDDRRWVMQVHKSSLS